MQNLLQPCGIPPGDWAKPKAFTQREAEEGPIQIRGRVGNFPVIGPQGCMPDDLNTFVETEKGIRRLQVEELGKAKGIPGEW